MREKLDVKDGSREMNVHDQIVTMNVGKTFAENNCVWCIPLMTSIELIAS
jgi:hypothetical protein